MRRVPVGGVADDEAGLAHGSVSDQDAVHLALRREARAAALRAQVGGGPVLQAPSRHRRTVRPAHRPRHAARLLLPDLQGKYGSAHREGHGFSWFGPSFLCQSARDLGGARFASCGRRGSERALAQPSGLSADWHSPLLIPKRLTEPGAI